MIETVTIDWRFGSVELPAADRYILPAIETTGEYSGAEIDLYQALLSPGDVALDVGANVGVLSIAMGLAVGPAGRVLAYEPQPSIFEILQRNLARHGLANVDAHRAIVAAAGGEGQFADVQRLPDGTKLNFGGLSRETRVYADYGAMAPTPVCSIDDVGLDRCSFVKIDVEGGEQAVLAGMSATLERCRPILSLECDRPNAKAPWVDDLLGAGYRLWRFKGKNLREPNPKGASINGLDNFTILMAVAIPEERLAVLERIDRSALQVIDSRETLERLSRRILIHQT